MMIWLYRALLRLYPAGFRSEYGAEMTAIFADRAAAVGVLGRIWLILEAVPEIVGNAFLLHWEILRQDLRYTARTLRRAPGFAFTVIAVTALGVGANTAAFSVSDFVLVRPLPFPQPESIVRLCEGPRTGPVGWGCYNQLSPANFRDFQQQTKSFTALGAFRSDAVNLTGSGEPQRVANGVLGAEVFTALGVPPLMGRVFSKGEVDSGSRTVVLSYGLWQTQFAKDPSVLGKTLLLDGAPYVVIGVMPQSFFFPTRTEQLWTPLQLVEQDYENRNNSYLEAVGRLASGVTFEEARADLEIVVARLARDFPDTNEETGVSFFRMRDNFSPRFRVMLQALCGASLCILILACANLGNLLLARAGARERELAVRSALGAGKERLVRQLATESVVLATLGGVAGVLVAMLAFPLLTLMVPWSLPIADRPTLNVRIFGLAALFTAITALGFGLVPAIRTGSRAAMTVLRGRSGGRKQRYRSVLVAIEVAASVVLLVSSGLLIRAMLRVQAVDPGFNTEQTLTLRTVLAKPKYDSAYTREQFYQRVLSEVRRLPGVRSAAYTSGVPMIMWGGVARVVTPGQEVQRDGNYLASRRYVTPQLFSALGIPLLKGRDFEEADAANRRRVAVVSESFVQKYWPNEDPIGKGFLFFDSLATVIGVVGDIKVRGLERASEPQMYFPTTLSPAGTLTFYDPKDLVIRTAGSPMDLVPVVRAIIGAIDPTQPISDVRTMGDVVEQQTAPRAAQVRILFALAALALLLAGLGIYGMLAYAVTQQRTEIGVRLALGAEPGRIARTIVWSGLVVVLAGMLPGLAIAFAAGRSMSSMLFGVAPADPATMLAAVALCIVLSASGALVPALRAVRVSPLSVMRAE